MNILFCQNDILHKDVTSNFYNLGILIVVYFGSHQKMWSGVSLVKQQRESAGHQEIWPQLFKEPRSRGKNHFHTEQTQGPKGLMKHIHLTNRQDSEILVITALSGRP